MSRPYSGTYKATAADKRKTGHLKALKAISFLVEIAKNRKKQRLIDAGRAITQK